MNLTWVVPIRYGISLIPTVIFGLLFLLTITDFLLLKNNSGALIGHRIATWFRHYPIFYIVLTIFYGALIGHFFLVAFWKGT